VTLTELDSLRADTMHALLDARGRDCIWTYDVCTSRQAMMEAADRQNYDNLAVGVEACKTGKRFALIGPGIEDIHFSTPRELVSSVEWLCLRGYLSCYANPAAALFFAGLSGDIPVDDDPLETLSREGRF
jgi:hypothetical protein